MSHQQKYEERVGKSDSLLCVGLDPDVVKLPNRFAALPHSQFEFCKWIINETYEFVSAYKPNTAFFEARGKEGIEELKMTFDYLREHHPDIYTIADAKRGDIGNTNQGYVSFVYDYLGADSVTVHPYLGREALEPFLARGDKGVLVLCRTSNEGGGELQDLHVQQNVRENSPVDNFLGAGESAHNFLPLWQYVAQNVTQEWNVNKNCMLVVGATRPDELRKVRSIVGDMTLLLPGVGAQGADVKAAVEAGINSQGTGLMVSASRSIIFADFPAAAAKKLKDEINLYR